VDVFQTKNGWCGIDKGTLNGVPFLFYAVGDDMNSVMTKIINDKKRFLVQMTVFGEC